MKGAGAGSLGASGAMSTVGSASVSTTAGSAAASMLISGASVWKAAASGSMRMVPGSLPLSTPIMVGGSDVGIMKGGSSAGGGGSGLGSVASGTGGTVAEGFEDLETPWAAAATAPRSTTDTRSTAPRNRRAQAIFAASKSSRRARLAASFNVRTPSR